MAREFVEFIQSQYLPWQQDLRMTAAWGPLSRTKVLSEDADSGARTSLLQLPPGWTMETVDKAWCIQADEEIFVLQGEVEIDGLRFGTHYYAYLPSGFPRRRASSNAGAVLLVIHAARPLTASGEPSQFKYDANRLVGPLDTTRLKWDNSGMDPNINHLHAFRKNLRHDPDGTCRSYLLGGLPQGFPPSGSERLEQHPHAEEMFMVSGDMPCSRGIMRTGAYFFRPANILHGADCTRYGFLVFMRTPGSNKTISDWTHDLHPVTYTPEHTPVIPASLNYTATGPLPETVEY